MATFWEQIASLGIDLPHAAFYLAADRPPQPADAGSLAGRRLPVSASRCLIKETAAPAVFLLPLAWLPAWSDLSWGRWARLGLLLLIAVAVVAAWWWVLVWRETGLLFPLNSLRAIVPTEDVLDASPQRTLQIAWIAAAPLWAYLVLTRFRDLGVRLLAFGALALAPAVIATVALAQPERNLTAIAAPELCCRGRRGGGPVQGDIAASITPGAACRRRGPRHHARRRRGSRPEFGRARIPGSTVR